MSNQFLDLLSRDLGKLYEKGFGHDVQIKVGQDPDVKTFNAHSIVLRARSTYFYAALGEHWKKEKFEKPNISPTVFEIVLNYIYMGELPLEQYDAAVIVDLLVAIDELGLTDLINHVQEYIITERETWFHQNFAIAHKIAFRHKAFANLRAFVTSIMEDDPVICFRAVDFPSVTEDTFVRLLENENLSLEEDEVWEYVLKWGHANTSSVDGDMADWTEEDFAALKKTLSRALPLVRYFQISSNKFHDKVRPYSVLFPEVVDAVIQYHMKPEVTPSILALPARSGSRLLTTHKMNLIASWIDKKSAPYKRNIPYNFKLLLRGSRDGFSPSTFHRLCDNKSATIVIIKVAGTNEVLGGYNPLKWTRNDSYTNSADAFIFSLESVDSSNLSRAQSNGSNAIYNGSGQGPTFGGGPDLALRGNDFSTSMQNCCSNSNYQQAIRSTSNTFNVQDYEVYQVFRANK